MTITNLSIIDVPITSEIIDDPNDLDDSDDFNISEIPQSLGEKYYLGTLISYIVSENSENEANSQMLAEILNKILDKISRMNNDSNDEILIIAATEFLINEKYNSTKSENYTIESLQNCEGLAKRIPGSYTSGITRSQRFTNELELDTMIESSPTNQSKYKPNPIVEPSIANPSKSLYMKTHLSKKYVTF